MFKTQTPPTAFSFRSSPPLVGDQHLPCHREHLRLANSNPSSTRKSVASFVAESCLMEFSLGIHSLCPVVVHHGERWGASTEEALVLVESSSGRPPVFVWPREPVITCSNTVAECDPDARDDSFASQETSGNTGQHPLFWVNESAFPNMHQLTLAWNAGIKDIIWHGEGPRQQQLVTMYPEQPKSCHT
ncbi:hypothetical protein V6N11_078773 [Hibiscus sabdariffa]|uniref:Uncharacterized protein n=1 Tax=Hibiscus sabdariffa TaxID=183260 RepID=A0ABR2RTG8_9ROSI